MCGPLVAELGGERVEARLPGRQGRLLFAYLTLNRHRTSSRDELVEAVWGDQHAASSGTGLNPLISKVRRCLGPEVLDGRTNLRLRLSQRAWVDVEAAEQAVHRAESRVALGQWGLAWGPALSALFISERTLLPGEDTPWLTERRARLDGIHLRALEAYAAAALAIGGTELAAAIRCGRQLVHLAPLHESGYQVLMRALAAKGDAAEALTVYAELSRTLRQQLGVSPSPATQAVFESLLRA